MDKEQGVLVQVDRIFAASAHLNHDAILDFVTWLCAVSLEELQVRHAGQSVFLLCEERSRLLLHLLL